MKNKINQMKKLQAALSACNWSDKKLLAKQLTAAGIQFCQDEQFYIRPKLETAADTKEVKS